MHEFQRGLSKKDIAEDKDLFRIKPENSIIVEYTAKLEETVFGQSRACREVARAMTRVLAGFTNPNRPEFVGMFLGEPGVGKTEMGKAIARIIDPSDYENRLLVIDCSTFQQSHDISKLVGAPPGYVGYGNKPLITPDFLSRKNVIVFDEIEKADPVLHKTLLQVMEKGKLAVPIGESTYVKVENKTLNFAYSTILLTSNVGSEEIRTAKLGTKNFGFKTTEDPTISKEQVFQIGINSVKKFWRHMPEFTNRIDAVVVFDSLSQEVYRKLVDKFISECNENQTIGHNPLVITPDLKNWVISKTDLYYGGRELRRTIDKHIIAPAAEVKLSLYDGVPIIADISEEEKVIFFTSKKKLEEAKAFYEQLEKEISEEDIGDRN